MTMKEQEQRSGLVKGTNKGTAEEQQRINKGTIMNNQKQPEKKTGTARNKEGTRENNDGLVWDDYETLLMSTNMVQKLLREPGCSSKIFGFHLLPHGRLWVIKIPNHHRSR